jgi:hypothetical protein
MCRVDLATALEVLYLPMPKKKAATVLTFVLLLELAVVASNKSVASGRGRAVGWHARGASDQAESC